MKLISQTILLNAAFGQEIVHFKRRCPDDRPVNDPDCGTVFGRGRGQLIVSGKSVLWRWPSYFEHIFLKNLYRYRYSFWSGPDISDF